MIVLLLLFFHIRLNIINIQTILGEVFHDKVYPQVSLIIAFDVYGISLNLVVLLHKEVFYLILGKIPQFLRQDLQLDFASCI